MPNSSQIHKEVLYFQYSIAVTRCMRSLLFPTNKAKHYKYLQVSILLGAIPFLDACRVTSEPEPVFSYLPATHYNEDSVNHSSWSTVESLRDTKATNNYIMKNHCNISYNLGNTLQSVINRCMTDADKKMLTLVNNTRAETQNCGEQSYPPASSLAWNCELEQAADAHNRDMGNNNFFSHTGSDGLSSADRILNADYSLSIGSENLGAGQRTLKAVMSDWMNSPDRCTAIMNPSYTDMGAAKYKVTGSDYPIYWTQNFAQPGY